MGLIKIDTEKLREIKNQEVEALRRAAYEKEADPLFFRYQRGEITQEEWQAKIDEIKARYPRV